jgi:hypothetical protein
VQRTEPGIQDARAELDSGFRLAAGPGMTAFQAVSNRHLQFEPATVRHWAVIPERRSKPGATDD